MSTVSKKDVEFLKNKYINLKKELESLKNELKLAQPNNRATISDKFFQRNTEQVFLLNETNQQEKPTNKNRLKIYELVSGIVVDNITSEYYPIVDKDDKVIETNYYKFEVDAVINQMKFHISYVSNQNFEDCYNDKVQVYNVKELEIFMNKKIHQSELKPVLQYFQNNPNQFGLAMLCLKDYERLFNIRSVIKKTIVEENPDFVQCNYSLDDNDKVYLEIIVGNDNNHYFTLNWSIVWVESLMSVNDKFDVEVVYKDEDFLESVNHNFEKLIDNELSDIFVSDIKDERIREDKTIETLTEKQKLNLIKNAILAAKAAE